MISPTPIFPSGGVSFRPAPVLSPGWIPDRYPNGRRRKRSATPANGKKPTYPIPPIIGFFVYGDSAISCRRKFRNICIALSGAKWLARLACLTCQIPRCDQLLARLTVSSEFGRLSITLLRIGPTMSWSLFATQISRARISPPSFDSLGGVSIR